MGEYLVIRHAHGDTHLFRQNGKGLSCEAFIPWFYDRKGEKVYSIEDVFNLAKEGKIKGNPTLCADGDVSLSDDQGNHLFFTRMPCPIWKHEVSSNAAASVSVAHLPSTTDEGLQEVRTRPSDKLFGIGDVVILPEPEGQGTFNAGDRFRMVIYTVAHWEAIDTGLKYDVEVLSVNDVAIPHIGWIRAYRLQVLKVMVDES